MGIQATWTYVLMPGSSAGASHLQGVAAGVALTADEALTRLYSEHFRTLVRIAALLIQDIVLAEKVTESAFAAAHGSWQQQRDTSTAADFLRREVVRLARDARQHQPGAEADTLGPPSSTSLARQDVVTGFERSAAVAMLRTLPERQREALVLRFYGGLSEAQAAAAMDVSETTLKACTTRGMAAWRRMLEQESRNEVPSKRSGDDPRTGHAVSR